MVKPRKTSSDSSRCRPVLVSVPPAGVAPGRAIVVWVEVAISSPGQPTLSALRAARAICRPDFDLRTTLGFARSETNLACGGAESKPSSVHVPQYVIPASRSRAINLLQDLKPRLSRLRHWSALLGTRSLGTRSTGMRSRACAPASDYAAARIPCAGGSTLAGLRYSRCSKPLSYRGQRIGAEEGTRPAKFREFFQPQQNSDTY